MSVRLQVNGESRELPERSTVRDLLERLELGARRVAVERNRSMVPKDRFDDTILDDGDVVEIVHFVGGG